jgi:magnesium transporter
MQSGDSIKLPDHVEIIVVDSSGNLRENVEPEEELSEYLSDKDALIWCDISSTEGGEDGPYWRLLSETFGFDVLTVEDCFKPSRLPLINNYGPHNAPYVFMVLFAFQLSSDRTHVHRMEVNFYLGQNYAVCVHSEPLPAIDRVRSAIRARDRFVTSSAANIAYTALDAITDKYQPAIEALAEQVDMLEERLLGERRPSELVAPFEDDLFNLKNHLALLRRIVIPQRDNMNALVNATNEHLISSEGQRYFQDVGVHLDRVVDSIDAMREHLTGISEAYTTRTARRTNQQLTRLTAISTLFLPLGFITGLYGMNFVGMPELHYKYGYFVVLGVFVILIIFMLRYLRRSNMI